MPWVRVPVLSVANTDRAQRLTAGSRRTRALRAAIRWAPAGAEGERERKTQRLYYFAAGTTTAMKSLVQPVRYWLAGRTWPGTAAVSGPPGLRHGAGQPGQPLVALGPVHALRLAAMTPPIGYGHDAPNSLA